jgi:hypothetical protein
VRGQRGKGHTAGGMWRLGARCSRQSVHPDLAPVPPAVTPWLAEDKLPRFEGGQAWQAVCEGVPPLRPGEVGSWGCS